MLEVDAAMGTLTIPIWLAGAATAVFLALAVLAIGRAGVTASTNVLFRVAIVAIAVSAGWVYIQRMERQEYAAEIRSLDARSAALVAGAVAPGSALPCLDEIAGETVVAGCEKAVFASAETVAAAVSYVAAKLAMVAERSEQIRRAHPSFGAEPAPLLAAALDTDRFGIVAHVLAHDQGCTPEKCDALSWFDDPSRVLANLRDHTFEEEVAKFAAAWGSPPRAAMEGGAASDPSAAGAAALGSSQRYEFPSSQSIPPVNIMVPESQAPRAGAPNGQSSGDGRPATTPVPPRRPAQGRASGATVGSRPSGAHPAAPVAVGEVPTDGAASRASGSGQPQ